MERRRQVAGAPGLARAGVPPHLRARVVEIGPGRGERPMVVTTSVDEVCLAVRNWLEALQARGSDENGDGTVTEGDETQSRVDLLS